MSNESNRPAGPGQLRYEAAVWFTRMRGPDAEAYREDFDRWLARGALHRSAYNRIAERFAEGKHLKDYYRALRRRRLLMAGAAITLFGSAVPLATHLLSDRTVTQHTNRNFDRQFASVVGPVRRLSLPDGSAVVLDSDSLVAVRFDAGSRRIELRRGRARFSVAHEGRPFLVTADDIEVVAKGTVFDVCVRPGAVVDVGLLRGAVTVVRRRDAAAGPVGQPVALQAGEMASRGGNGRLVVAAMAPHSTDWPSMRREFDGEPLSEIIAQANRYNSDRIEVPEIDVRMLRVSGTFRIDDAARLAERLATLFDLDIDRSTPGVLSLRRRVEH